MFPEGQPRRAFVVVPHQLNRERYEALIRAVNAVGFEGVPVGRTPAGDLVAVREAADPLGPGPDSHLLAQPQYVAPPPVKAEGEGGEQQPRKRPIILGSLDKDIIRRVVRSGMPAIRRCYESALPATGRPYGKVVLKWVIQGSGTVRSAVVNDDTLADQRVLRCMLSVIKQLRFPKPKGGGTVIVNYPFVFKPPAPAVSATEG